MSDHIPFHIQEDIIKRLPVKPLIQFRSVSKAWKSLIDSFDFIVAHNSCHTHPQHVLVKYEDLVETDDKYVSFIDDGTSLQQRFVPTLPLSVKSLKLSTIVGSSHGLLCLHGYHWDPEDSYHDLKTPKSVIWNPSIRKSIVVAMPDMLYGHEKAVGFGVCPLTSDPKIVEITQLRLGVNMESNTSNLWTVKLYTLSSGKWRSLSGSLPNNSIRVTWSHVVTDRFIYWCAFDMLTEDTHNLIMSFDITNENFRVIDVDLPDSLAHHPETKLSVSKLRGSLAMLQYNIDTDKDVCVVWTMGDGVQRSITKLFSISAPHGSMTVLGFRKSGQPLIEVKDDLSESSDLAVYEPNSEAINDLEICGITDSLYVNSYMESLLLLDRIDSSSY